MSTRIIVVLSFALVLAQGCGGRSLPPSSETGEQHDDRFVGLWRIEAPLSGLYWGSIYRFETDGTLVLETTDGIGFYATAGPTGVVGKGEDLRCIFGDAWHSPDIATLHVLGLCSDETEREIVLSFHRDPSHNTELPSWPPDTTAGAGASLVSVGGEGRDLGWSHDKLWQKCAVDCGLPQ